MNNKRLVPEAKEAMDKFKMEAASEVGVTLKQGYIIRMIMLIKMLLQYAAVCSGVFRKTAIYC